MGEGVLRDLIHRSGTAGIEVASAGTLGIVGAPATDEAVQVARAHGVDISEHRSSALTARSVSEADVILAMTAMHVAEVVSRFPEARERTTLLSVYADGSDVDVPDPIGGPVGEYESAYGMIEGYLKNALPKIAACGRAASEENNSV
jgi:protein-tyrosine-phosphatase